MDSNISHHCWRRSNQIQDCDIDSNMPTNGINLHTVVSLIGNLGIIVYPKHWHSNILTSSFHNQWYDQLSNQVLPSDFWGLSCNSTWLSRNPWCFSSVQIFDLGYIWIRNRWIQHNFHNPCWRKISPRNYIAFREMPRHHQGNRTFSASAHFARISIREEHRS